MGYRTNKLAKDSIKLTQKPKEKIVKKISRFFSRDTHCQHSKNEAVGVNNTPETEKYEHCVMCGKLTCVPISMPVDWRENYEIGFGQICTECAKKQREAIAKENALKSAQIVLAVGQSEKENNK